MSSARRATTSRTRTLRYLAGASVLVVLACATLLAAPVEVLTVASSSMQPTLSKGDRLVAVSPRLSSPHRGSIVVFDDPGGWLDAARRSGSPAAAHRFVKRVVGVGGDTVHCCSVSGDLEVNGVALAEPYLRAPTAGLSYTVTVPRDSFWVLGDERNQSFDSRFASATEKGGFVPLGAISGVVIAHH